MQETVYQTKERNEHTQGTMKENKQNCKETQITLISNTY